MNEVLEIILLVCSHELTVTYHCSGLDVIIYPDENT